jgi:hypothetical protein
LVQRIGYTTSTLAQGRGGIVKINASVEGIVTGVGLALAASVLLPAAKRVAGPLAVAGMQGVAALRDQVKSSVTYVKEEIEDIVAEAQFERLKNSIDQDILH